jgi:hypothetical protein
MHRAGRQSPLENFGQSGRVAFRLSGKIKQRNLRSRCSPLRDKQLPGRGGDVLLEEIFCRPAKPRDAARRRQDAPHRCYRDSGLPQLRRPEQSAIRKRSVQRDCSAGWQVRRSDMSGDFGPNPKDTTPYVCVPVGSTTLNIRGNYRYGPGAIPPIE